MPYESNFMRSRGGYSSHESLTKMYLPSGVLRQDSSGRVYERQPPYLPEQIRGMYRPLQESTLTARFGQLSLHDDPSTMPFASMRTAFHMPTHPVAHYIQFGPERNTIREIREYDAAVYARRPSLTEIGTLSTPKPVRRFSAPAATQISVEETGEGRGGILDRLIAIENRLDSRLSGIEGQIGELRNRVDSNFEIIQHLPRADAQPAESTRRLPSQHEGPARALPLSTQIQTQRAAPLPTQSRRESGATGEPIATTSTLTPATPVQLIVSPASSSLPESAAAAAPEQTSTQSAPPQTMADKIRNRMPK